MTLFQAYIAPARARPGWWRILLGVLIIAVMWVLGNVVVLAGWVLWNFVRLGDMNAALGQMGVIMQGGDPLYALVILATFGGVWPGVWLALWLLHGQRFGTIFSPGPGRRPGGFFAGVALALLYLVPAFGAAMLLLDLTPLNTNPLTWAAWLIPIGALVFVQATAEELLFRGYLQQQLAARTRHWVIWAGVPAALFGLMHVANAQTLQAAMIYVLYTFIMGLLLSHLVWRTGSLWTATGVHWANNFAAIVVLGSDGALSGAQIWTFPRTELLTLMYVSLAAVGIVLLLLLSPLGRVLGDGRSRSDPDRAT